MWFSEDLNPTFSTAQVITVKNQRVDLKNAHIAPGDPREMDVSLQSIPPGVYVVIWRTQSADDGHILTGSFIFKVANPDGSIPSFNGALPGTNDLGSSTSGLSSGQLDGPSVFSLIMTTLVDLGVIFWVGAQLWRTFVLQLTDSEGLEEQEQHAIEKRANERFERIFSLPTLLVILLANLGILVGQALSITGGNWLSAFSPALLAPLAADGRFGTYWTMREIVVLLAIALTLYMLFARRHSPIVNEISSWAYLLLGLALLIAVTMSGHAAAVNNNIMVYAVLGDWLHLLAASLWIGGMIFLAVVYLPVLRGRSLIEQARSLLAILPRYSPLAITGVIIMAVTGPFNATVHMDSFAQLLTTAYGRTLDIKVLLVAALLATSATHVGLLRPRLAKEYNKYSASLDIASQQGTGETGQVESAEPAGQPEQSAAGPVKQLERQVARRTQRLSAILRWEPLLGVAVLVCTGLLTVFAGTLQPPIPQGQQPGASPIKPFVTTVKTTDNKYTIKLNVSPNRFGTNVFTVTVLDSKGAVDSNVGVSIYTTMLDMDMGTDTVNLQPDGKGNFSSEGDLSMSGHYDVRIQIRTPDNTLHEADVKMFTPFG